MILKWRKNKVIKDQEVERTDIKMTKSIIRECNMKLYGNKFENWKKHWKRRGKMIYFFSDNVIVNLENPKESSKSLLEIRREFGGVDGSKKI